jgi:phosphatidylglycerol:prolipoprotein diacylglycerol transferase
LYSARPRPAGAVTGLFGVGYGLSRTFVEFFREPDAHIGYLAGGWLTMGMLLSIPMIVVGAAMIAWAYKRDDRPLKRG